MARAPAGSWNRSEAVISELKPIGAVRREEGGAGRRVALLVMCAGYFLVLLDVTIVNVALPAIAAGLDVGVSGLQWVVDGYALALAALMLAGGTIGDLHGHKRVVLAGFAVFGIASLGCGLAPDEGMLVLFRVAQGVGAALMLPGTLAVITHAYPDGPQRARAIGIWAGVGSSALVAGPLLGGMLTQLVGWRAVFFLNVPIVAIAFAVAARLVQESREPSGSRLDVAGIVLGGGLLTAATFAIIEAGHAGSGISVAATVTALGLAAAFVAVERSREDPMLPLTLFRDRVFSTANAVAGAMNFATLGLLFVLTLYLQDLRGRSALAAGLELLPLFVALSVLAPFGGRLTARIGPRWTMTAGLLTAAAGVALLVRVDAGSGLPPLLPALLLCGVGLGLLTPAVVAAAVGAVPAERAGLGSAVNNTARQACGAIGIAAFGALAGDPSGRSFLRGLHLAALVAAALFVLGALATATLAPAPPAE